MRIGVLSLQGDVREHILALRRCGVDAAPVRYAEEIEACDGLIIPGGESTTIGKLIARYGLKEAVRSLPQRGRPVFGTCAGLIMLARDIEGSDQFRLGLMDMVVRRNAFGRQVESFEADLDIPALGEAPFRGVFIRAPIIHSVGPDVEVLACHDGDIVLARQGKLLTAAFHPELTDDLRVHRYFLGLGKD